MKKILTIIILLALAVMIFADTVVIGTGTSVQRFPLGSFWGFERSAALYTDADLGAQNTRISSISWFTNTATSVAVPTKIYLKTTGSTTLTTNTWANMIAGATLVYDATQTGTVAGGWNEFVLNSTFDVDDGNGVIVLVERNYGGGGNGTFAGAGVRSTALASTHLTWNQDSTAPTGNGSTSADRPNVTLTYTTYTLSGPPNPAVISSPANAATGILRTATLIWGSGGGVPTGYRLSFGTDNPPTNIVNNQDMAAVTTYDPNPDMAYGTTYYWQVIAYNGNGDAVGSPVWSFTTMPDPTITTFPYNEGFESAWTGTPAAPPTWSQITVSGTNVWNRYGFTPNSGTYCAQAPWASAGGEHLLISPPLSLGTTTDYRLKFWLKGSSSAGTDLDVQIASSNSAAANFVTNLSSFVAGTNMPTVWTQYTISLADYTGIQFIAFRMTDLDGYSLYIDDFLLEEIPEVPIFAYTPSSIAYALTAENATTAYTNVVVTNNGGGTLNLAAGAISLIGANANQFGFTTVDFPAALTAGQSVNIPVRFQPTSVGAKTATLRISYDGMDYDVALSGTAYSSTALYESFENVTFPPAGWANPGTWSRSTTTYSEGLASAYKYSSTTESILSTPLLTMLGDSSVLFMARTTTTNADQRIQVKYSSDRTTWTSIGDPIALASNAAFAPFSVDLSSLAGNNYYIGFAAFTAVSAGYIYMDQVVAPAATPLTPDPVALVSPADVATAQSELPTLSWTSAATGGVPTGFKVYCDTTNPPTTLITTAAASPYTFTTALNYETTYYWSIVATNANGDAVGSAVRSFTTRPNPTVYTFPWSVDFGTLAADWLPTNWTKHSGVLADPTVLGAAGTGSWFQDDWLNVTAPLNKAAKLNLYGTSAQGWMITPPIAMPGAGYQLEFDVAYMAWDGLSTAPVADGTDDRFEVLIGDGTTWTPANIVRSWDNAGSAYVLNNINPAGEHITIDLSGVTGTKYIAFYAHNGLEGDRDNDLMFDNVMIRETPVGGPEAVTLVSPANNATGLSAAGFNLTWTPALTGGIPTSYRVYMATDEATMFEEYSWVTTNTSFNPVTEGLVTFDYLDYYYWTVKAINDDGEATVDPAWAFEIQSDPNTPVTVFPYVMDFEAHADNSLPSRWTRSSNATGWEFGTALWSEYWDIPDHTVYAAANDDAAGSTGDGSVDILAGPIFDFSGAHLGIPILTYDSFYTGAYGQIATVEVSINGGVDWTVLSTLSANPAWVTLSHSLAAYDGMNSVRLRFHADDDGEYASGWAIDNFSIDYVNIDLMAPIVDHYPVIGWPTPGTEVVIVADINDDLTWNSGISSATLNYSIDGGAFTPVTMTLVGDYYQVAIPGQVAGSLVAYNITAIDASAQLNTLTTATWDFYVDTPVWMQYDSNTVTNNLGLASGTFGVMTGFENPLGAGNPIQINSIFGRFNAATTVNVHIYTYDAGTDTFTDVIPSFSQAFLALTDTTIPLTNCVTTAGFFYVAFTDIVGPMHHALDGTQPYYPGTHFIHFGAGMTTADLGTIEGSGFPGSWLIRANIEAAATELDTPVVNIVSDPAGPMLGWAAVTGANSYKVYASDDPAAADPWPLLTTTMDTSYTYTGAEDMKFFKVIADSALATRVAASVRGVKVQAPNSNRPNKSLKAIYNPKQLRK